MTATVTGAYRCTPQPPQGAALVHTTAFNLAQRVAAQAAGNGAVAGFFGPPGVGKTHAVDHFVARTDIDHVWITSSPSPTTKEIFEELLWELDSTEPVGSARQLRKDCHELLAQKRRIVIVDEAQYLSTMWLKQLRYLHDAGRGAWALFLVGGVSTREIIARHPELNSRLRYQANFTALRGQELHTTLAALHPVLAATPTDVLDAIDRKDGFGGSLRGWVTFLRNAEPLLAASKTPNVLTTKVVRAAFATMGIR